MRLRTTLRPQRAGMTVLEVVLAISLLAVVTAKIVTALDAATEQNSTETAVTNLEGQARQVLRQIGFAVMGSHPDTLVPNMGPNTPSSSVRYQINLGVADGEVVWSDPEQIALIDASSELYWTDEPDNEEQRRITWSKLVAPYLEGEVPNGMDDNGNGLIDEKGLALSIEGTTVTMRLTLERLLDDGTLVTTTEQTTVACRNLVNGYGATH